MSEADKKEIARLREALSKIQEMAEDDIRTGKAEGTMLYQIEADARAILKREA